MEPLDRRTRPGQALPGTISRVLHGHRAVIWLQGDIDLAMAGELCRAAALPQRVTDVVLDLSRMTFCDGTLTAFINGMLEHRTVWLRRLSPLARDYLLVVGLADRLQLVTDRATARPPGPEARVGRPRTHRARGNSVSC